MPATSAQPKPTTPATAAPAKPAAPPAADKPINPAAEASASEKPPADYLGDIAGDLEQMDASNAGGHPPEPSPEKAEKPTEKPKAEKPEESAPAEPEAKPETPPAEPTKPSRAAPLREAYEKLKKETAEVLRPTIQRLESRIKELEASPEQAKPLQEKLTALEARNRELEQHIAFVDYSKSAEFRDKYEAPFNEAYSRAVRDFGQLTVRMPDGEDEVGEPKFKTRTATADDLVMLASLPLSEMDERAEQMFGRSAPRVINHVEKVRELYATKEKALTDAQKLAAQHKTTIESKNAADLEARTKAFDAETTSLATKYPKMFAEDPSDAKGNELLKRGLAEADRAFKPTAETRPKTTEETIKLFARIRLKAANHDRLVLRLRTLRGELDEAKKALAEYENSSPSAGKAGDAAPDTSTDPMAQIDAELAALDRK